MDPAGHVIACYEYTLVCHVDIVHINIVREIFLHSVDELCVEVSINDWLQQVGPPVTAVS